MILFSILEDVYIMRDPFADDNLGGIIIGADCLICKKMVCVSPVLLVPLLFSLFRLALLS